MKFEIIMSYYATEETKAAKVADPRKTFEMEGDLDAVKTYLKLAASKDFNWGAITRTDELEPGDVNRWMIKKNRTTGDLWMEVFSFFAVDPLININAMRAIFDPDRNMTPLNKALGGGIL
jgi:hypothetical protein